MTTRSTPHSTLSHSVTVTKSEFAMDSCSPLSLSPPTSDPMVETRQAKTPQASPANRFNSKALTPTTVECLTPSSYSTRDTPGSQRCDESSARSNYSLRVPLPSPSRSRLDQRYAKRLAIPTALPQEATPPLAPSRSSLVGPPGITRDASIFRPTPVLDPSWSGSSTGRRHAFPLTMSRGHQDSSLSFGSTIGSTSTSSSNSSLRLGRKHSRSSWDLGASDRFIPSRATSNMNVDLWDSFKQRKSPGRTSSSSSRTNTTGTSPSEDSPQANTNATNTNAEDPVQSGTNTGRTNESTTSQQQNLHNVLLRTELLGENRNPYSTTTSPLSGTTTTHISAQGMPLQDTSSLRFQSPRQAYRESMFGEGVGPTSVVTAFGLTPVSAASQRLMAAPQKRRRRIAKVPFKILDAPALADDFYLDLVDWSAQNVLAVGLGSCIYLWSACTSKVTKLCDLEATEDVVTSVSWAQRGTHLAVGTHRGEIQLWDTIKCKKVRTMAGHAARVGALAWTGPCLASGSRDRLIFLRDVRVQAPFTDRLTSHKQEVCGLKWSYDEPAFLASGGNDNQLHVSDSRKPSKPVHRFSDHTAGVKAIAWSPHQHGLLASGGGTADRCIRFWNSLSGSSLHCVDTGSQVCNLAWSQNCNEIVSTHGYSLNQIVVWRYPSLSKVVTLTGHTCRVLYLAVSPDGSTIVTGAGDETLRFWQVFPGPRSDGKNNSGGLLFPNTLGSVIR